MSHDPTSSAPQPPSSSSAAPVTPADPAHAHPLSNWPPPPVDPAAPPAIASSCPTCGRPPAILSAIARAIGDIQAVGKSGWNDQHKYHFRTIDDFYDALSPVLAKQGLVIQPNIVERKRDILGKTRNDAPVVHLQVRYRYRIFAAADGSYFEVDVDSESIDYGGDKAPFKAASGAYKYLVMQVFAVRVKEEHTAEPEDDDVEGRRVRRQPSGPPPSKWKGKAGPREDHDPRDDDSRPIAVDEPGPEAKALEAELAGELEKVETREGYQAWATKASKAPALVRSALAARAKDKKAALEEKQARADAAAAGAAAEGPAIAAPAEPTKPATPSPASGPEPCWAPGPDGVTCQKTSGHGGGHKAGDREWAQAKKGGRK